MNLKVIRFDIPPMLGIAWLLWSLAFFIKKLKLSRWKGLWMPAVYVVYGCLIFIRP